MKSGAIELIFLQCNTMKTITNQSGRVIAYENDVSEYRKEIRDRSNSLLGWYNPKTDKTHDRTGRVISNSGDIRGSLIPPEK